MDNSKIIRQLLSFDDPNDFYLVEVIKRRKDNPGLKRSEKTIRMFYVDSFDDYDELIPDLIKICEDNRARAYIRVNKRNYKDLNLKILKRMVVIMENNNYRFQSKIFESVAGEFHSEKDKKFIVDVDDTKDVDQELLDFVYNLQGDTKREPFLYRVPTLSGFHIITRPFNVKEFKKRYPQITIHRDNPTLLVTF